MTGGTPQQQQAMQVGNAKRLGAAALVRETRTLTARDGAYRVVRALQHDHDDPLIGSVRIGRLLRAVHYLGEHKTLKCLIAAKVPSGDMRLRDLDEQQRASIAFQLEVWAVDKR